jgi:hypothetical protein
VRHVSYSLNFLFAVEETLCCGDTGIAASIHITGKAAEIVHSYLYEIIAVDKSYLHKK